MNAARGCGSVSAVAVLAVAGAVGFMTGPAPRGAQAAVVWSETFDGEADGAAPSNDFLGGTPTNDWGGVTNTVNNGSASLAVSTAAGNAQPSLLLDDQSTSNTTFLAANFGSFGAFNMNTAGQERLTISLDFRADAYGNVSNGSNSMLRFFVRDAGSTTNALTVGFGRAALADGDAGDDLFLVVAPTDAPLASAANAVGFTGSGWAGGFDLGNWSTTDADNDTNDAFYHFDLMFEAGKSDVVVTAYPVADPSQAITFTRTTAAPLSFSNTGSDGLTIQSGSAARGVVYVDNLRFESSAVPEPAAAGLIGLAGVAVLGRRRARRNGR